MKTKKQNNNLICVKIGEHKYYYTSANRAGVKLGLQQNSVNWAINHKNKMITENDEIATVEIVDGSEIPYKYINVY